MNTSMTKGAGVITGPFELKYKSPEILNDVINNHLIMNKRNNKIQNSKKNDKRFNLQERH